MMRIEKLSLKFIIGRVDMLDLIVSGLQRAVEQFRVDPYWETTAFVGEAVFGGRFILQWIVSEYKKKSHVPVAFWYMSIVGSIILLAYFVHKASLALIITFAVQILIYVRNLHLIKKHKEKTISAECPELDNRT